MLNDNELFEISGGDLSAGNDANPGEGAAVGAMVGAGVSSSLLNLAAGAASLPVPGARLAAVALCFASAGAALGGLLCWD